MPLHRLLPLALLLACAATTPGTPRSIAPIVAVTPTPHATPAAPTPEPDSDSDSVNDHDDRCPDEQETRNQYRDGDGCPDEGPNRWAYFLNSIHPVRFSPSPPPRRGAPTHAFLLHSDPEQATEIYPFVPPDRFLTVATAPRSTFVASTDTAAYPQLRRFLAHQTLPPPGMLRIESLLNYFTDHTIWAFSGALGIGAEVGPCPWAPTHRLVRLRVQAHDVLPPPRTVILLIDVSRSMGAPERLPLLKQALPHLLNALRPGDRVAVLGFHAQTELILPPTDISERSKIEAAITSLRPRGDSERRGKLDPTFAVARDHHRPGELTQILLATDGVGSFWTPPTRVHKQIPDLTLSVLELGMGDVDDHSLSELAEDHDGQLLYLDTIDEARRTFTMLAARGAIVARDLQLQAVFSPTDVIAYRQLGAANQQISAREFGKDLPAGPRVQGGPVLGRRRAGDLVAGQGITLLYEIVPTAKPTGHLLTLHLRAHIRGHESQRTLNVEDPGDQDLATTSDDFRFSAAVAELGLLVHGGPHGTASLEQMRALIAGTLGTDHDGQRRALLDLLTTAAAPLEQRIADWDAEHQWLQAHPAPLEIPTAAIPDLRAEAMRMQGSVRYTLIGHHDGIEGRSLAEREALARARAMAVHRYLVEVMHHPHDQYEVRVAGPKDYVYPAGDPRGRCVQIDPIWP